VPVEASVGANIGTEISPSRIYFIRCGILEHRQISVTGI